jgi:NTE family protein
LMAGKRIEEMIAGFVGAVELRDLKVPFVAVAVDVAGGEEVRLKDCALVDGIRASFGIPGLFAPKRMVVDGEEHWLVDGGVASPVPVGAAAEMRDLPVVAVNVNKGFERPQVLRKRNGKALQEQTSRIDSFLNNERVPLGARDFLRGLFDAQARLEASDLEPTDGDNISRRLARLLGLLRSKPSSRSPGMVDSLYNSVVLLQHHLARAQFQAMPPALLIEPNLEGVGLFDFHLGDNLVDEGVRATRASLGLTASESQAT